MKETVAELEIKILKGYLEYRGVDKDYFGIAVQPMWYRALPRNDMKETNSL